jgi:hypothetical protein
MLKAILKRLGNWRTLMWVVVIVGLVGAAYYFGFFGGLNGTPDGGYDSVRSGIQDAVTAYQDMHDGELPVLNRTVTVNGSTHHLIDMCVLTYKGEFLGEVPAGCAPDNCVAGRCTCADGSYIWTVDDGGNVSSTCISLGCEAYQVDGYQGVWP